MTDFLKSEQYIKQHRAETTDIMCRFAATDLLFFWAEKEDIYSRQLKVWQPFLDDVKNFSNTEINISRSLLVPDNKAFIEVLKNKTETLTDKELTAAFSVATRLKSVILGLAFLDKKSEVERIFNAAFLEELYQNELWGVDAEVAEKREQIRSELQEIKEYLYND